MILGWFNGEQIYISLKCKLCIYIYIYRLHGWTYCRIWGAEASKFYKLCIANELFLNKNDIKIASSPPPPIVSLSPPMIGSGSNYVYANFTPTLYTRMEYVAYICGKSIR